MEKQRGEASGVIHVQFTLSRGLDYCNTDTCKHRHWDSRRGLGKC